MKICFRLIAILLAIFLSQNISAQNITGTWEGIMPGSGGTYLQVNVQQEGFELCGYTYDYVLYDKSSYCRAKFEGRFDSKKNLGLLVGTGFIANSGSHVLMRIKVWRQQGDNRNTLRGVFVQESLFSSFFGSDPDEDIFVMKRVAATPNKLPANIPPCFPKKPASKATPFTKTKPVAVKPSAAKPAAAKPAAVNPPSAKPVVKKPAAKPTQPKAVTPVPVKAVPAKPVNVPVITSPVKQQTNAVLVKEMNARKKSEQSRIVINTNHLNLKLYDNGTVDNDSVSIFYNGRLLLSHQRLSEKAIELNIDLDEGKAIHEITMYAENLGSIAPNTALVVVTAGGKRYELRSKANLEENAVLIFEVKKE